MPTYGVTTRAKARLNVLRGFKGNEPQSLSYSAKPKADEAILSGMIISLDSNGEWVKGCAAGVTPYFAQHDQADLDVVSSGLLVGLSCAGDYELQTAHFDTSATIANDVPLVAHATNGTVVVGALDGTADIIGFSCRGGKTDRAAVDNTTTKVSGYVYVLGLYTRWMPLNAA